MQIGHMQIGSRRGVTQVSGARTKGWLAGSALGCGLAIVASAAFAGPPVTGTAYRGDMTQIDQGQTETYPMVMTLSGSGGRTDYPSLKCGGALTRIGFSGGYVVYREAITYGGFDDAKGQGCVDGIVTVLVSGRTAHLGWYGVFDGRGTVAHAELTTGGTK